MTDFWRFTMAVASQWIALVGGTAIIVFLGVLERLVRKEISLRLYGFLLISLFFYSCYLAWSEDYALTAELKDGTKIEGESVLLRESYLKLRDPKGDTLITYPVQPNLVQRASQNPIVTGGEADGVMTFIFPAAIRRKITESGAFLIIEVMDINQKTYTAKIPMKPSDEIMITPGMLPPR